MNFFFFFPVALDSIIHRHQTKRDPLGLFFVWSVVKRDLKGEAEAPAVRDEARRKPSEQQAMQAGAKQRADYELSYHAAAGGLPGRGAKAKGCAG